MYGTCTCSGELRKVHKRRVTKKKEIAISIGIKRACKSTKIVHLHECQACTNLCIRYVHHRKKK